MVECYHTMMGTVDRSMYRQSMRCSLSFISLSCLLLLLSFQQNVWIFSPDLSKQQSTEVHAFASGEASPSVVLNADGVYTASVAALQLCYKLSQRGFYKDKESHHISVTQVLVVDMCCYIYNKNSSILVYAV